MRKLYTVVIRETKHIFKEPNQTKELERYEHQSSTQVKYRIGDFILQHSMCSSMWVFNKLIVTTTPKMGTYVETNLTVMEEAE